MGARKPKGLNRIEIIWFGHLYLREENLRVNNKYMIWGNWFICCWQRKYTKYWSKQLFELLPSKWKLTFSCLKKCAMNHCLKNIILPFWCVFNARQAIKTAARDLVLHGIVSQSNQPSIINGVRFYDCCSNINCRLSRSKKNFKYQFYLNFNWFPLIDLMRF